MTATSPIGFDKNYVSNTLIPNYNRVATQTELGPTPVYQFSYAGGNSSYSFGVYQYNIGTNPDARTFLSNVGFTQTQISQLSGSGGLTVAQVNSLSTQLQTALQNPANAAALTTLDTNWAATDLVPQLQAALNNIYQSNPGIADQIYASQSTQLALLDYANQLHLDSTGALEKYLAGLPSTTNISSSTIINYIMTSTSQGTNPATKAPQQHRENSLASEILAINPSESTLLVTGNVTLSGNNVAIIVAPQVAATISGSNDKITLGNGSTASTWGNNDSVTCGTSATAVSGTANLSCNNSSISITSSYASGSISANSNVTISGVGNSFSMGTNSTVTVEGGTGNTLTCNGASETVSGNGTVTCTTGGFTNGSGISVSTGSSGSEGGGDSGGSGGGEDGGGDGGGCVSIDSLLPDGRRAGDIQVGDTLQLADGSTLEAGTGVVTYSFRKTQPGFLVVTQSGASLRCSASAPIPTPEGLVLAPNLLGKKIAVRRDGNAGVITAWESVEVVKAIGNIDVQHITVGDRCFWAGETSGVYILHHNLKKPDDPVDAESIHLGTGTTLPSSLNVATPMHASLPSSSTHAAASLISAMATFAVPDSSQMAHLPAFEGNHFGEAGISNRITMPH